MGCETKDISGTKYILGVTDFNAESFVELTIAAEMEDLLIIVATDAVFNTISRHNCVDYIDNKPTFMGVNILVSNELSRTDIDHVFETWIFSDSEVCRLITRERSRGF